MINEKGIRILKNLCEYCDKQKQSVKYKPSYGDICNKCYKLKLNGE